MTAVQVPPPGAEDTRAQRRDGRGLVSLGIALLVAAVVGAIVLAVVAAARYEDAVERLARAPVGCDTTLEFSETGEFLVFVETTGRLDEVRGDCDAPTTYSTEPDDAPALDIVLTGPDGAVRPIEPVDPVSYDTGTFVGRAELGAEVVSTGSHTVRVVALDAGGDVMVAVGRDPDDLAAPARRAAVGVATVGVVFGVIALGLGLGRRRRSRAAGPGPAPSWGPVPPPAGPPLQPPALSPVQPPRVDGSGAFGPPGGAPLPPPGRAPAAPPTLPPPPAAPPDVRGDASR